MPDLVTLTEVKDWLGIRTPAYDPQISALADNMEGMLESAGGRTDIPLTAASAARVEVIDGTGTPRLYLDYRVSVMTEVLLGYDVADPVETLDVSDVEVFRVQVGKRRIARVDGGVFGWRGAPGYVQVTYDHQADLPATAKLPFLRACAAFWEQRGSEDASRESLGDGSSRALADFLADSSDWALAVGAIARIPVT